MAVAIRARDGEMVRVDRDSRVRLPMSKDECRDTFIKVAQTMGLNPRQAHQVFLLAARSQRTLYRHWDRLEGQPLRLAAPDDNE